MARPGQVKARELLRILERAGFVVVRVHGSHRLLRHRSGRTLLFAIHDRESVGPKLLSRILKDAGLTLDVFERLR